MSKRDRDYIPEKLTDVPSDCELMNTYQEHLVHWDFAIILICCHDTRFREDPKHKSTKNKCPALHFFWVGTCPPKRP